MTLIDLLLISVLVGAVMRLAYVLFYNDWATEKLDACAAEIADLLAPYNSELRKYLVHGAAPCEAKFTIVSGECASTGVPSRVAYHHLRNMANAEPGSEERRLEGDRLFQRCKESHCRAKAKARRRATLKSAK